MLWLTVKCANGADPDFRATARVICDCSNHITLDIYSLDYHCWEERGSTCFSQDLLAELILHHSLSINLTKKHKVDLAWCYLECFDIFLIGFDFFPFFSVLHVFLLFLHGDEDTPLIVPKCCQPASLGKRAHCEVHA